MCQFRETWWLFKDSRLFCSGVCSIHPVPLSKAPERSTSNTQQPEEERHSRKRREKAQRGSLTQAEMARSEQSHLCAAPHPAYNSKGQSASGHPCLGRGKASDKAAIGVQIQGTDRERHGLAPHAASPRDATCASRQEADSLPLGWAPLLCRKPAESPSSPAVTSSRLSHSWLRIFSLPSCERYAKCLFQGFPA